jgi:filamentous hemagglutinin family protein
MPKPKPQKPTLTERFVIGASPATALGVAVSAVLGMLMSMGVPSAQAGDILRGGATSGARPGGRAANPSGLPAARQNAARMNDSLSRTTKAVQSVRAMQDAARQIAIKGPNNLGRAGNPLPNVPNGLRPGGLQVAPGVPRNLKKPGAGEDRKLWTGALLPTQVVSDGQTTVNILQTKPQAVLNWQTFNIGKDTTLRFDQSRGGSDQGKWIAFNKINDPSGRPSQILGSIEAPGQVYVINRNGIIFGGSSQVNTRGLVASSLPINDNLVRQGLLNNRDAQFLFSALPVAGGSDGTPAFNPTISDPEFRVGGKLTSYTLGRKSRSIKPTILSAHRSLAIALQMARRRNSSPARIIRSRWMDRPRRPLPHSPKRGSPNSATLVSS